jgi:D-amino peptidase
VKVFISADMEGISGVINPDQTLATAAGFTEARKLMTADVNAAVEGALAAGATEILVNDSHSTMRNIILEDLNPQAVLISGGSKPMSMVQGLDASFDACMFIGYHGKSGTASAIMDHTYYPKELHWVKFNGSEFGETGANAAVAGYYGVPLVLVTGDAATAAEAKALIPGISTVEVKQGVGRYAAACLHPSLTRKMIRKEAAEALTKVKEIKPLVLANPVTVEIELTATAMADQAQLIPGMQRTGPRRLEYTGKDYLETYHVFLITLALAAAKLHPQY